MSDGQFQMYRAVDEIERSWAESLFKTKPKTMTGVEKIAQERLEQKTKHRHSIKGDYQQYPDFELADLAYCIIRGAEDEVPECFPKEMVIRLLAKPYQERLVIAGALIAAEIDRLNFEE